MNWFKRKIIQLNDSTGLGPLDGLTHLNGYNWGRIKSILFYGKWAFVAAVATSLIYGLFVVGPIGGIGLAIKVAFVILAAVGSVVLIALNVVAISAFGLMALDWYANKLKREGK